METSFKTPGTRGLWNNPRPTQCSKETQEMLRLMKEESRLACLQRKQINRYPKRGAVSSQTPGPSSLLSKCVQRQAPVKTCRRSAESCRAGDSYVREKFHPGPTRDLEKEKRRLQNILATGEEEPTAGSLRETAECCKADESEETERYQEVLNEIEERRQFLADMAALGQEHQYIGIINAEISQRLRELDILDQADTSKQRADN